MKKFLSLILLVILFYGCEKEENNLVTSSLETGSNSTIIKEKETAAPMNNLFWISAPTYFEIPKASEVTIVPLTIGWTGVPQYFYTSPHLAIEIDGQLFLPTSFNPNTVYLPTSVNLELLGPGEKDIKCVLYSYEGPYYGWIPHESEHLTITIVNTLKRTFTLGATTPPGGTYLVDGSQYSSGTFEWTQATTHTVEAVESFDNGNLFVFDRWDNGSTSRTRTIQIRFDMSAYAIYTVQ